MRGSLTDMGKTMNEFWSEDEKFGLTQVESEMPLETPGCTGLKFK